MLAYKIVKFSVCFRLPHTYYHVMSATETNWTNTNNHIQVSHTHTQAHLNVPGTHAWSEIEDEGWMSGRKRRERERKVEIKICSQVSCCLLNKCVLVKLKNVITFNSKSSNFLFGTMLNTTDTSTHTHTDTRPPDSWVLISVVDWVDGWMCVRIYMCVCQ